jgi:hypothetical protein
MKENNIYIKNIRYLFTHFTIILLSSPSIIDFCIHLNNPTKCTYTSAIVRIGMNIFIRKFTCIKRKYLTYLIY